MDDRRRSTDPQFAELVVQQSRLERRVDELESKLDANTVMTRRIDENTVGIVDAWNAAVGGLKVLGFLAKLAKWAGWIAAGVGAIAALMHFGNGIRPK